MPSNSEILLAAGEMKPSELAAVKAVLRWFVGKHNVPSLPVHITAEQLSEVKDQCEAGLQVEHECPAMFALAAIYAELFASSDDATVEKE